MNYQGCLDAIAVLVGEVPDTENIYKRRVVYNDAKDFQNKFGVLTENKILGFQIYRSGLTTEFLAFNKKRHTHTFTITGIIGVIEKETPFYSSYDKLTEYLQLIQEKLNNNLTLNGNCTDSDFASLGNIDFDTKVGKLFWSGDVSIDVYDDEIFTENIS